MNDQQHVSARVTHRFSAPAERVFDAWLDPAMIGRWMFGPGVRDEEVVRISLDSRVGGPFSFGVRRQGEEIDHTGNYLELDRPRRLVFTWSGSGSSDSSRVIIDIAPLDAGCELTLVHELHPSWAEYAGRARDAWTKMLTALATTLGQSPGHAGHAGHADRDEGRGTGKPGTDIAGRP